MVVLGGVGVSYERGTPVHHQRSRANLKYIRQSRLDSGLNWSHIQLSTISSVPFLDFLDAQSDRLSQVPYTLTALE